MKLQELLGIELPIIQAPMAGVQGSVLAVAVSNAGGLGSLPCAMLSLEWYTCPVCTVAQDKGYSKEKTIMARSYSRSRRTFLHLSGVTLSGAALVACAAPAAPAAPTSLPTAVISAEEPVKTPDQALQRLMEGNQRYVANKTLPVNESASRRAEVAQGQQPFATIFSCVDSRVPPELVFDRGLGDLFVIRTAGHVIDNAVLGSLEFGVAELRIPLLLVMGHEKCGAVKATIETVEKNASAEAEINWLVEGIRPAVEEAKAQSGDLLDNAVNANIALTVERLKSSPILAEALQQGTLQIVGARYDLDTGSVEVMKA